ncbi:hypothetical protein GCM10015535_54440 [Streptomyces gelaticus]|uniref:Transposase n=1 Tax=Streptomyces gelaticus TaxID=285446 RepID=A0ABQ2W762_9ACTN|nr:hypothetical protein [Streptomyces gelaticus]GGV92755.1 hypothetical protein GCM10015535_54440 [Streptomyces gelaticus]
MRDLVDEEWTADAVYRNVREDRANRNGSRRHGSQGGFGDD